MDWAGGSGQTGYIVARLAGSAVTLFPSAGFLPAGATGVIDPSPARGLNCYILVVMGPSGAIGRSDGLCAIPNTKSASGAPRLFTIQLNESDAAFLTWIDPGGGQDGYVLQPFGGPAVSLAGSATTSA